MRNVWLVVKREYLERVRTRAFVIFTLLMPALVGAMVFVPAKLAGSKSGGTRHVVVVVSDASLGEGVRRELQDKSGADEQNRDFADRTNVVATTYKVDVNTAPGEDLRQRLVADVGAGNIDGFVWLTDEAITARKFRYSTKNANDFVESSAIRNAVSAALMKQQLSAHGVSAVEAENMLRRISMDTIRVDKGKESKPTSTIAFLLPFLLMMMIYMTVLLYGVAVMRSVLEEKTNRVVEVLLSSITARELMAGKILGVGAVGLTQILIWAVLGGVFSAPTMVAMRPYLADLQMPVSVYVFFPVFFVLGYMLYSTMYAGVASMVNSEEEAQQMQWPIILPLILCTVFAMAVIRQPNSQLAFWTSMFPLTAPIVMFVRIVSQQPPMWQIGLSVAILVVTIYGLMSLCSRIFRVGILMYGKRPTLPELLKWVKYSG